MICQVTASVNRLCYKMALNSVTYNFSFLLLDRRATWQRARHWVGQYDCTLSVRLSGLLLNITGFILLSLSILVKAMYCLKCNEVAKLVLYLFSGVGGAAGSLGHREAFVEGGSHYIIYAVHYGSGKLQSFNLYYLLPLWINEHQKRDVLRQMK